MKETADESAELKMTLKRDPETPELAAEAVRFPAEAGEALYEVESDLDYAAPGSWAANRLDES